MDGRVPSLLVTPGENGLDPTTELALRARGGDAGAQAAFVRATQAEVWRFTAALVDPGAADDLTQETYLRAFKALPGFEARSSVRTWLLGIARRACADHLRVGGAAAQARRAAGRARPGPRRRIRTRRSGSARPTCWPGSARSGVPRSC